MVIGIPIHNLLGKAVLFTENTVKDGSQCS